MPFLEIWQLFLHTGFSIGDHVNQKLPFLEICHFWQLITHCFPIGDQSKVAVFGNLATYYTLVFLEICRFDNANILFKHNDVKKGFKVNIDNDNIFRMKFDNANILFKHNDVKKGFKFNIDNDNILVQNVLERPYWLFCGLFP